MQKSAYFSSIAMKVSSSEDQRVYKSCIYPTTCIIMVMYVDNNGVRHNCEELLAEFESEIAKDGRIDLHLEGDMSSFLSVRYLNKTETGEITADQEAYNRYPARQIRND